MIALDNLKVLGFGRIFKLVIGGNIMDSGSGLENVCAKREDCPEYNNGNCDTYQGKCFHENKSDRGNTTDLNRCNKLVPATDDELMEWMDPMICSDCNEVICSDCDQYLGFRWNEQGYGTDD